MVMHDKQLVCYLLLGGGGVRERCCLRILSLNIAHSFQYEFAEVITLANES